jgi:hypothetical protein
MQKIGKFEVDTLRQSKKAEIERTLERRGIANELRRAVIEDPRKYIYLLQLADRSEKPKVRGNATRLADQTHDAAIAKRDAIISKFDAAKNRKFGQPLVGQALKPKESDFRGFDLDSPSGKGADEFFNKQADTAKGRNNSEPLGYGLDGKPKDNGGSWSIF